MDSEAMPETIESIALKRRKWVDANRENGFEAGLKRLLTDLYPDNAHFIYELLQNAEDARAQEVRFILHEDRIEFEHDGERLFSIDNVDAITSIGFSTKRDDATSIGQFGVGFKAVFAYTETPEVESGEFHFRIRDMVVPEPNGRSRSQLGDKQTRFILPFDNHKKGPEQAKGEIERLLKALGATTLLFLTHIRKIEYLLPDSSLGYIERIDIGYNRYEIRVQQPNELAPSSTWFLKFDKEVEVEDEESEKEDEKTKLCRIAVAFGLSPVAAKAGAKEKKGDDAVATPEWELAAMEPGRVCIYFPADKETSNLRFHLHAPFASTVARDSVRDCAGNNVLRDHLAELLAESMSAIRDQGLLTVRALAVLPNDRDNLSEFYVPLMGRLVTEFKEEDLVPMKRGSHAAADGIFRGTKALSDLIDDDDMLTLLGDNYVAPIWASNPPQRNQREDNFSSMLGIEQWDTAAVVKALGRLNKDALGQWMGSKDERWHQALYSMLNEYLNAPPSYAKTERTTTIKNLALVRCSDETYRKGSECFFPTDGVEHEDEFPRVASGVYSSGSDDSQKEKAKTFLSEVGVQELDRIERVIRTILSKYQTAPDLETVDFPTSAELKRIVSALLSDSKEKTERLLTECRKTPFIKAENAGNMQLALKKPGDVWLPEDDGLLAYLHGNEKVWLVHEDVIEVLGSALGQMSVQSSPKTYHGDGKAGQLVRIERSYSHKLRCLDGFHPDFDIEHLKTALSELPASMEKSAYIWNELLLNRLRFIKGTVEECNTYGKYVTKDFIPQKREEQFSKAGQLLHHTEWIPDGTGGFRRPNDVRYHDLPEDWNRNEQLARALGVMLSEQQDIDAAIKDVGFDSLEEAKEMARLKKEDPEGFQRWRESRQAQPAFPERTSADPERRKRKAKEKAAGAPDKQHEKRERSVRTSRTQGKAEVEAYLRDLYTNDDDQLICQICQDEMPFREKNGKHYFEKVEAFDLPKELDANYLALCPVCAAKYDEFVFHGSDDARDTLRDAFAQIGDALELPVTLGEESATIRFVQSHAIDLRAMVSERRGV